ncbi:hypothetical protein AAZV13_09G127200 [Glycine max]
MNRYFGTYFILILQINSRDCKSHKREILSVLDENGSSRLDLGMFFAILAPICGGPPDRLKRVAFDALLWRPMNEDGANIRKFDATLYIKLLRAVYLPSQGVSELMEVCGDSNTSMMSFSEFLVMFDDPDWGFGIMPTLVKLEIGDRNSHGDTVCSVCCYLVIGSRFKEFLILIQG